MGSILGLIVLLLATLTLGGCAGLPGALGALGALGNGGAYGGGYGGGAYSQGYPAAAGMPVDPGYAGGYAPQAQPYYAPQPYANNYNGATVYAPGPNMAAAPYGPQGYPTGSQQIDQREREQAARIRQGLRNGSLTPQEAQRLWAEQRRIRGAEGRMMADGSLNPQERARLAAMQNHANQDIYGARHNGMVQPGAPMAHPGNGPMGPRGPMGPPQINGAPRPGPMQAQVRPMQPGHGQRVQPGQPSNQRPRRIAVAPGQ
jgi:hypothetical protein